jgi:DNA polymerase-1
VSGLAIVTDPEQAEVAWIPAALLADDRVAIALAGHHDIRGHNVKPLMRSLLAAGADAEGLTLDTAIAAYLIDPAEARYTLPDLIEKYTRFARPSDVATAGQLDLDGTSMNDAERAGRDALAVTRSPGRSSPASKHRGWPSCTAPSRTRSWSCSPRWSTSGSPSTSPNSRRSAPGCRPRSTPSAPNSARWLAATI